MNITEEKRYTGIYNDFIAEMKYYNIYGKTKPLEKSIVSKMTPTEKRRFYLTPEGRKGTYTLPDRPISPVPIVTGNIGANSNNAVSKTEDDVVNITHAQKISLKPIELDSETVNNIVNSTILQDKKVTRTPKKSLSKKEKYMQMAIEKLTKGKATVTEKSTIQDENLKFTGEKPKYPDPKPFSNTVDNIVKDNPDVDVHQTENIEKASDIKYEVQSVTPKLLIPDPSRYPELFPVMKKAEKSVTPVLPIPDPSRYPEMFPDVMKQVTKQDNSLLYIGGAIFYLLFL